MKFQELMLQQTPTDTGVEVKVIGDYSKLLPFVGSQGMVSSSGLKIKCIGQTLDWRGGGRGNIYVFEQRLPLWLFYWVLYRLERTWEHLIIAFVLLLQIWGLAKVSDFERPSIKHIFKFSNKKDRE